MLNMEHSVMLSGRNEEQGNRIVSEITALGGKAKFFKADITKVEDCAKFVKETIKVFGKLDIAL